MRAPAGILTLLAACLMASAIGARAEGSKIIVKVKTPAKVYYEPMSTARVVDQVNLGVPVTVVEDRGEWVRVQTGAGEGWIERTYVDLPGPGGMVATRYVTVKSPTTLYFEPAPNARVVENIATGPVKLVEDRGDWVRVRTTSGDGWIQRTYVDLSGSGNTMTTTTNTTQTTTRIMVVKSPTTLLVDPAPTSRVVEGLTMGAPVTVLEDRGEWIRVHAMNGDGWVQKTYVDVPGPDGTTRIVTVKSPATLLVDPTTSSRVLESLSAGPVTLVEDRGDWVRVKTSTGDGWLQRTYVDLPGSGAVVTTRVLKLTSPTTLMVEPSSTGRVLEALATGAPITLVEEQGDWIRVKTSTGEGWIKRTYVETP